MVKRNYGYAEFAADAERLPRDLIWIARFDNIGPLALERFFDRVKIQERAITRRSSLRSLRPAR
jgi:hypothetical protein